MPPGFQKLQEQLRAQPKRWLVTGVAGFIGSHLLQELLSLEQEVVGIDNFSTGFKENLDLVQATVGADAFSRFTFHEGDAASVDLCRSAADGADYVLHQAALASVPRSIANPLATNHANVSGFLAVLVAAKDAGVERFVYASSSSVYGDDQRLPKQEDEIGRLLSPYAVSKRIDELYADVFDLSYGLSTVGLRYFNVFGPRQDPGGPYAAVIPRWIEALQTGNPCIIFGDGETSRDFCYVENAVQANILAACSGAAASGALINVAVGERTSLNELHGMLIEELKALDIEPKHQQAKHEPFREGDIRHSLADISRARELIGYSPGVSVSEGVKRTVLWFLHNRA